MRVLKKLSSLRRQYVESETGSFAIMAAVVMLILVMCIGVVIDISNVHKAQSKVQSLADTMGLTAAIYVRDNDTPPTSSEMGFVDGQKYKIDDINYGQSLPDVSGKFSVKYNDALQQAEVKFKGKMKTNFMSAFNKSKIKIRVESTVKYYELQQTATSVILVVDNSGSMAWDDIAIAPGTTTRPAEAKTRIEGLKSTVLEFSAALEESMNSAITENGERYLRTGLVPYSTDVIQSRVVDMDWGTWEDQDINAMAAGGGTDSRGPLDKALDMMDTENASHEFENGTNTPKKYLIFMTDGSNNEEYICDWQANNSSSWWRKYNGFKYDYRKNYNTSPGTGWERGTPYNCSRENRSNPESLETCQKLKDEGVVVVTIGYALESGEYFSNQPYSDATETISESTTDAAYSFLNSCAQSDSHFVKAKNTQELRAVFGQIGKQIAEDSVRIAG